MVGRTSAEWRLDGVLDGGAEDKGGRAGFGLGGGAWLAVMGQSPPGQPLAQATAVGGLAFCSGEELSPTLHAWGTTQG